jgi:MbtH protein
MNMNTDVSHLAGNSVEEDRLYLVVINGEEQYSIWFADREIPAGWTAIGAPEKKDACIEYIKTHWTDMRPASLRRQMEQTLSK